jgi:exosortase A-associated hydrolase 1
MTTSERGIAFRCEDARLVGIVTIPPAPSPRGVVVIVGGPQYRAGSHRQFTYLCRGLAEAGIASLRFDYRGMGDSEGDSRSFEAVDADIRAAVDALLAEIPAVREIALWGLCDAASAALFYAHTDARVTRLVLANPWVRTGDSLAVARVEHYYRSRIVDPALWRNLFTGKVNVGRASREFLRTLAKAAMARAAVSSSRAVTRGDSRRAATLPDRMASSLERFRGRVLIIRSGKDLTAQEFTGVAERSMLWRKLLAADRVSCRDLPPADHTFSTRAWRDAVTRWTSEWILS